MRNSLLLCVVLFLVATGCKKHDVKNEKNLSNILSSNAHVIDTLAVLNCTTTSLTLDGNEINFIPSVGDIILASPSADNHTGVFSKIQTISRNGSVYTCSTEPTNLNEAFRQLYIDYRYVTDYSQNAQLRLSNDIHFPQDFQLAPGVTVNGVFRYNIEDVHIIYHKPENALLPDTVLIQASINTDGSDLVIQTSSLLSLPEKTLYTFYLPVISVPIVVGGIPLFIPFQQRVEVNTLPISVSGKMKFRVHPELSAALKIGFIDGNWVESSTYNVRASAQKPVKSDFDGYMEANFTLLAPTYKINPLFVPTLDAYLKLSNQFNAKIQTQRPNYSLKYNLELEAGIHYDFWTGVHGQKSFSVPVYSAILKEGNFGYNIGDTAFGGLVFYVDPTTSYPDQKGLVCAMSDQSNGIAFVPFRNPWPYFNASGTSIGTGSSNSSIILSTFGNSETAATLCANYSGGGFSDWYLPSIGELNELCLHKDSVPISTGGIYWSSTAMGSSNTPYSVLVQNFSNCQEFSSIYQFNPENGTDWNNPGFTPSKYRVRAVRKF